MNATELINAACQWLDGYLSDTEIAHFRTNMLHKATKKSGQSDLAEDKAQLYANQCVGTDEAIQRIKTAYMQGYIDASDDWFKLLW